MKKISPALFCVMLLPISCKKQEAAKVETTTVSPGIKTQEDFTKEAKSRPLTTLALSEPSFDFGKIKKESKVSHTFTVTNTGDKPLVISAVRPGCGCTASDFTKEPILPGKSGKITLNFDSTHFQGVVHKFAQVFANVEKAPITLTFTANIQ